MAIVGFLLGILLFNIATATRYPNVWRDEVQYTAPAANLVSGRGFTSSMWFYQASDRFWTVNMPLHPLILSGWIRVFGLSPLSVRSIDYVWFALGTFFLWRFCVRIRWVEQTRLRLLLVILLACGSAVSFSYRSGRCDMLGYFLSAVSLCAATLPKNATRYACLLALGFLFPWAGLALLPMLAIATILVLAFWGVRKALNGVCLGAGAALGLGGLFVLYQSQHVWQDVIVMVTRCTVGSISQSHAHGNIAALPEVLARDRSAPFLLLLTAILAARAWNAGNSRVLRITLFALAVEICIPIGVHLCGMFPIYYGWMAALPATLTLCHALSLQPPQSRWAKGVAVLLLSAAILVGLPFRMAGMALGWSEAPYSALETFVSSNLNNHDCALIDEAAYYPAFRTAKRVFATCYLETAMRPEEKKSLTALVIAPEEFPSIARELGGDWKFVAEFKSDTAPSRLPASWARYLRSPARSALDASYHLAVYRQAPAK